MYLQGMKVLEVFYFSPCWSIFTDAAKQTLDKYLEDLLKYVQPDAILDQFAKDDFMRDIDIRDIRVCHFL